MEDLDQSIRSALAKRRSMPEFNDFTIAELLAMPRFFDWVTCRSGAGHEFRMFLAGGDDGVALRFFWNGRYETQTLKIWSTLAGDSKGIKIDVGAHTGVYTLAALAANPANVVLSFEPHFMNYARLNLNLRANGISTKRSHMLAVGERRDKVVFSVTTDLDYLSTGGAVGARAGGFNSEVQIVHVDGLLTREHHANVSLIKIDVEGHEPACLRGMIDVLRESKPVLFFECIDRVSGEACAAFLRPLGYHFFEIDDRAGSVTRVDRIVPATDVSGKLIMHRLNRIASCKPDLGV
jgi:FkbM family methyltransferase